MILPAPTPLSLDPDAALASALQRARSEIAALGRGRRAPADPSLSSKRVDGATDQERSPDHEPQK